jgi:hypothetical protein
VLDTAIDRRKVVDIARRAGYTISQEATDVKKRFSSAYDAGEAFKAGRTFGPYVPFSLLPFLLGGVLKFSKYVTNAMKKAALIVESMNKGVTKRAVAALNKSGAASGIDKKLVNRAKQ